MPEKKQRPKKAETEHTNPRKPEREDLEAEIPQAPAAEKANEPLGQPVAIDSTRGPRPLVEAEVE
jgi:hypothetical protein